MEEHSDKSYFSNHADTGQELQFIFTSNITMRKKCDLSDFNQDINVVDGGWFLLRESGETWHRGDWGQFVFLGIHFNRSGCVSHQKLDVASWSK